jgi:hypothetical protein
MRLTSRHLAAASAPVLAAAGLLLVPAAAAQSGHRPAELRTVFLLAINDLYELANVDSVHHFDRDFFSSVRVMRVTQ